MQIGQLIDWSVQSVKGTSQGGRITISRVIRKDCAGCDGCCGAVRSFDGLQIHLIAQEF
jgi:hypothetical protein